MSSPSEEHNHFSHSCAGASSSKVLMDNEEGENSQSLWGSMSDSEIPIATHFSPIYFADWTSWSLETPVDCSVVDYPPNFVQTPGEGFVLDKKSREYTDWFPKLEGVTDYHSIKFGKTGFYEYDSCYFPKNWPKKETNQENKKWESVHNLPHDVLVDMGYFGNLQEPEMYVSSEAKKGNPPKTSFKEIFQEQEEGTSRTTD